MDSSNYSETAEHNIDYDRDHYFSSLKEESCCEGKETVSTIFSILVFLAFIYLYSSVKDLQSEINDLNYFGEIEKLKSKLAILEKAQNSLSDEILILKKSQQVLKQSKDQTLKNIEGLKKQIRVFQNTHSNTQYASSIPRKQIARFERQIQRLKLSATDKNAPKTYENAAKLECYSFLPQQRKHFFIEKVKRLVYETTFKDIYLEAVSRQKLEEYEGQREIIEWVRGIVKPEDHILYSSSEKGNILNIVMLASFVTDGKLILVREKLSIELEVSLNQNKIPIERLTFAEIETVEMFLGVNVLITQNSVLLTIALDQGLLDKTHVLADLSKPEVIYPLEVKYILKKISWDPVEQCDPHIVTNFSTILSTQAQDIDGLYQITKQTDIIYTVWLGGDMSENRLFCLREIVDQSFVEVKLITVSNLPYYIKPQHPFHKAYEYLSQVHRGDYFRSYLMNFYGGGYTDLKHIHFDWRPFFKQLSERTELYGSGYHEIYDFDVGCVVGTPKCTQLQKSYAQINGNSLYILRKETPLTSTWVRKASELLDELYEELKANPAQFPRDKKDLEYVNEFGEKVKSKYPVGWTWLHGTIFQELAFEMKDKLIHSMPFPITVDYQ